MVGKIAKWGSMLLKGYGRIGIMGACGRLNELGGPLADYQLFAFSEEVNLRDKQLIMLAYIGMGWLLSARCMTLLKAGGVLDYLKVLSEEAPE